METQSTYNYQVVKQFAIMTVVWGIVGMAVGVFIGASLGSRLGHRVQLRYLRLLFVAILLYTAYEMARRALGV